MIIKAIKSSIIQPGDNLLNSLIIALKESKEHLKDNDIISISSKVMALSQSRISREKKSIALVEKEAQLYFKGDPEITLKENILIASAGIDESNVPPPYKSILWPKNPWEETYNLLVVLKKEFNLKNLGLILTDSICQPLRRGVTGIALAYAGFEGVEDCRAKKDLFGKELQITQRNIADSLASASLVVKGEGSESCPFALIRNTPITFSSKKTSHLDPIISPRECLFSPIYPSKLKDYQIS